MAAACVSVVLLLSVLGSASAQLSTGFYSSSCPNLLSTVKPVVQSAISSEKRMGASLLRLFFHDCFVNGCDASLLLDDTSSFTGEKTATPNQNSLRGFDVIDNIKTAVEKACPGVVSCADILAITARDAVVIVRAHTIGQARCISFRSRIYNDTDIDSSLATTRQSNCPSTSGSGDGNLAPLDLQTPTTFDNDYFKNLVNLKSLLHSDQQLFSNGSTDSLVKTYSDSPSKFASDFAAAMINMGDISPLTGSQGEIRNDCRKVN
ncbi:hypothetical protein B296_00047147 [Ensete ventricosum]|uniref:peroxidase n=1 Tax=Ensete ventricosum TaxID=4639 RepID=A0A426XEW2_ENSVE|nr:hypothetical protein B296_00047147 [Ensete ventricosum]